MANTSAALRRLVSDQAGRRQASDRCRVGTAPPAASQHRSTVPWSVGDNDLSTAYYRRQSGHDIGHGKGYDSGHGKGYDRCKRCGAPRARKRQLRGIFIIPDVFGRVASL